MKEREIDDHKMKLAIKIRFNANMESSQKRQENKYRISHQFFQLKPLDICWSF